MARKVSDAPPTAPLVTSPAYQQIEQHLLARIRQGEWPVGAMLPSLRALAAQYHVGISTMQRALQHLLAADILSAKDRRGTFVMRIPTPDESDVAISVAQQDRNVRQIDTSNALTRVGIVFRFGRTFDKREINPDPWTPIVMRSFEDAFARKQACCYYYRVDKTDPHALHSMEAALAATNADRVQALAIVSLSRLDLALRRVDRFAANVSFPIIILSVDELPTTFPHVCADQVGAGYQAARHLLEMGYRRIVVLRLFKSFQTDWLEERITGAFNAVRQAGLPDETITCVQPTDTLSTPGQYFQQPEAVRRAQLRDVLSACTHGLTPEEFRGRYGIIAPSDPTAVDLLAVLADCQLTPGKDVGLASFDNELWTAAAGLTTMAPPLEAMGSMAADLLLDAVHGRPLPMRVSLCAQVIPRASTQR